MSIQAEAIEVGFDLPEVVKEITPDLLRSYSERYPGIFIRTIHVEREAARAWGFPDLVLQGSQTMNFASEILFKTYREHWIDDSSLTVKFTKPVFAGQRVITRGKVVDRVEEAGGKVRLTIDIKAENQDGDAVMVGRAGIGIPSMS